jgi:NCAIR mutase (PurE)-related protein
VSAGRNAEYQKSFDKGYEDGFKIGFLLGKAQKDTKSNIKCTICTNESALFEKSEEEIRKHYKEEHDRIKSNEF